MLSWQTVTRLHQVLQRRCLINSASYIFGVPWQACMEEYVLVQMNICSGLIVQYSQYPKGKKQLCSLRYIYRVLALPLEGARF